jgi:hypothetical protein
VEKEQKFLGCLADDGSGFYFDGEGICEMEHEVMRMC